jgi:hypothetical protein
LLPKSRNHPGPKEFLYRRDGVKNLSATTLGKRVRFEPWNASGVKPGAQGFVRGDRLNKVPDHVSPQFFEGCGPGIFNISFRNLVPHAITLANGLQ